MKNQPQLLIFIFLISLKVTSQVTYQSGYFINNSGEKVECLIKNSDWNTNPDEFKYKITSDSEVQKATIGDVREFGIDGEVRYVRADVNIDRSGESVKTITSTMDPEFHKETLFLKTIVKGEASLYGFQGKNITRFFFSKDNSGIEQLVFKKYLKDEGVATNSFFKKQLYESLKCEDISLADIEEVRYSANSLKELFMDFNTCMGVTYESFESTTGRDVFNLSIKPGLISRGLSIHNTQDNKRFDFGDQVNFRIGAEVEYILPFNNGKWSLILEPNYHYFKADAISEADNVSGGVLLADLDYTAIDIPLGLRHYLFLGRDSKLFANISFVLNFTNDSRIDFTRNDGSPIDSLDISPRTDLNFGAGYKFKDRYSLEIRYQLGNDLLGDYLYWTSDFNSLSFILGYTLF